MDRRDFMRQAALTVGVGLVGLSTQALVPAEHRLIPLGKPAPVPPAPTDFKIPAITLPVPEDIKWELGDSEPRFDFDVVVSFDGPGHYRDPLEVIYAELQPGGGWVAFHSNGDITICGNVTFSRLVICGSNTLRSASKDCVLTLSGSAAAPDLVLGTAGEPADQYSLQVRVQGVMLDQPNCCGDSFSAEALRGWNTRVPLPLAGSDVEFDHVLGVWKPIDEYQRSLLSPDVPRPAALDQQLLDMLGFVPTTRKLLPKT